MEANTTRANGGFVTTDTVNKNDLLIMDFGTIVHAPLSKIKFRWEISGQFKNDYLLGMAARDFKKGEFIDYIPNENTVDVLTNGEEMDSELVKWIWGIDAIQALNDGEAPAIARVDMSILERISNG